MEYGVHEKRQEQLPRLGQRVPYSLVDLRDRFQRHRVSTGQCYGNVATGCPLVSRMETP
jgi:hypothetical protein